VTISFFSLIDFFEPLSHKGTKDHKVLRVALCLRVFVVLLKAE